MAAIGEELRAMLGWIPVRDRAGIARSNLAMEAEKSTSGNAEGQALTRQGFDFARAAPPPVQLPDGMGEPDAANMPAAGSRPAEYFIPPGSTGGVGTPVPRERVVAASPAAAPSPAVRRNSDLLMQAMEQRARQQKMMQVVGSLGMIANAFNRNPQSQASTRSSLAGMMGGGGGDGASVADLKTILDMRTKEDEAVRDAQAREIGIDSLMRSEGYDRGRATLAYDSKAAKEILDPKNVRQRALDKLAGATREELMTPENIATLAKITGYPEAVVRAGVRSGEIDPKKLADIGKVQADTAKTGVETRTLTSTADAYTAAKADPMPFARALGIRDMEELQTVLATQPAFEQAMKDRQITAGEFGKQLEIAKREDPTMTAKRWKEMRPGVETREEWQEKKRFEAQLAEEAKETEGFRKSNEGAIKAAENLGTIRKTQQDLWDPNLISGGGWVSGKELEVRRLLAKAVGRTDVDVSNTTNFQNFQIKAAIDLSKDLKGPTTEKDMDLLRKAQGGNELNPTEMRRFVQLLDIADQRTVEVKLQQAEAAEKRGDKAKAQRMRAGLPELTPPNKFVREDMRKDPALVEALRKDPDGQLEIPKLDPNTGQPMKGPDGKEITTVVDTRDYAERKWGPLTIRYILQEGK